MPLTISAVESVSETSATLGLGCAERSHLARQIARVALGHRRIYFGRDTISIILASSSSGA
jgi:hypothetical protein